ncbi:MAG: hypothetical protein K2X71_17265 [Methylobacterium sp.]|uniref:hypothetical protein n=1 Tax=Methylobacterium sp. TaxID=409 RepID=UPI002585CE8D|nr:hypothetical protein [Methylobacterium sp.]MBY0297755.1 hypothetical protein [Methylobacterium sp.]
MRISTDERDSGYRLYAEAQAACISFIVTLDGVREDLIVTADDVAGEIVRHATDARGNLCLDPVRAGQFLRETIRGRVRIIRKHKHWQQG